MQKANSALAYRSFGQASLSRTSTRRLFLMKSLVFRDGIVAHAYAGQQSRKQPRIAKSWVRNWMDSYIRANKRQLEKLRFEEFS
jgi:hypothetical protein